jgi:hypothetical protein
MIWTIREKDGIFFYTSDNEKFKKLKDATNHVASNYNSLRENQIQYNVYFERSQKLRLIVSKMKNSI